MSLKKTTASKPDNSPRRSSPVRQAKQPPVTTEGTTRAFDARPKTGSGERRSDQTRPSHHVDREPSDPLDSSDEET